MTAKSNTQSKDYCDDVNEGRWLYVIKYDLNLKQFSTTRLGRILKLRVKNIFTYEMYFL